MVTTHCLLTASLGSEYNLDVALEVGKGFQKGRKEVQKGAGVPRTVLLSEIGS